MDESKLEQYAKIQAMVQKEAREIAEQVYTQKAAQFAVPKVPYHEHNGVDSPSLNPPVATYIGFVPYDITDVTLQYILPGGWSLRYDGVGIYTIIHNLGKISNQNFYAFVANATQSTNVVVIPVITTFENEVTATWFDVDGVTKKDTSFNFILTIGNKKLPAQTGYVTRNVI
jgi:hypothetical protein